ncbi:MAG: hypothetical protein L3J69_05905 [Desulfobacula sp.]|nr:hypothetical protein [Desulfobacula sp.]
MQKKKDIKKAIMDSILEGHHTEVEDRIDQLDCLIYKKDNTSENDKPKKQEKKVWQTSKENVTVQVWEGKAKIKVKVSPGKNKQISMKRIANVAMNAILEEFNKED